MSSSFGNNIKLTIFGQSHSKGIGMTLEGIPAGKKIESFYLPQRGNWALPPPVGARWPMPTRARAR